ncbi:MAG: hypothetical protein ACK4UQ_06705 [Brevundimonas sp.]
MPRWATSNADIQHIADVTDNMPFGGVITVKPRGLNTTIPGVMIGARVGNNGGRVHPGAASGSGPWAYHGEVTIRTLEGHTHDIDLLDIDKMERASDEITDEFVKAGLIERKSWPK